MADFLSFLKDYPDAVIIPVAKKECLLACGQELYKNKLPMLPESYIELLKSCNGIICKGGTIFGFHPTKADDLVSENLYAPLSGKLCLGRNDFDTLAWNPQNQKYEIIDNSDEEVLREYTSAELAVKHILKIENA